MSGTKRVTVNSGDHVGTLIGQGTQLKGSITATGALRIDGEVEGDIVTSSEIVIGETGNVKAQIKAKNATIGGTVTGNMEISERLELLASAKLLGDIKAGTLIIGEGAIFKGACEMRSVEEKKVKESKN